MSDEELIQLLQKGNLRYFSALAGRYERNIFNKCISYVRDSEAAADLTQEILIKVYLRLGDFRNQAKFSTWLFTIIHHTCVDHLRRSKKSVHEILSKKLVEEVFEIVDFDQELPEEKTIEVLDELLEQLAPEEKLLLLLKYKEKHHIKDIQLSLGLSESAVKMRLKRAKEKLNKLYAVRLPAKS